MSIFPACSIIEEWDYQGAKPKETRIANESAERLCVHVKDDPTPIIFRQTYFQKRQIEAARKAQEQPPLKKQPAKQDKVTFMDGPIHKQSLKQIKELLKKLGLPTTGTKEELIARFMRFQAK